MAYTFNIFTGNFDVVSRAVADTTPGGVLDALLLEDGFGLLLEDGTFLLLEA